MHNTNIEHVPRLLPVAAVAALLGVSRPTVIRLVRCGEIPAAQVGKQFRIPERGVYQYLRDAGLNVETDCRDGTPATANPAPGPAPAQNAERRATGATVR